MELQSTQGIQAILQCAAAMISRKQHHYTKQLSKETLYPGVRWKGNLVFWTERGSSRSRAQTHLHQGCVWQHRHSKHLLDCIHCLVKNLGCTLCRGCRLPLLPAVLHAVCWLVLQLCSIQNKWRQGADSGKVKHQGGRHRGTEVGCNGSLQLNRPERVQASSNKRLIQTQSLPQNTRNNA